MYGKHDITCNSKGMLAALAQVELAISHEVKASLKDAFDEWTETKEFEEYALKRIGKWVKRDGRLILKNSKDLSVEFYFQYGEDSILFSVEELLLGAMKDSSLMTVEHVIQRLVFMLDDFRNQRDRLKSGSRSKHLY